jgi:hypothetical protein
MIQVGALFPLSNARNREALPHHCDALTNTKNYHSQLGMVEPLAFPFHREVEFDIARMLYVGTSTCLWLLLPLALFLLY